MTAPTSLACPTCRRKITWSEQFPWRPFCSERCRMVDLGTWLTGGHAIAGDPVESAPEAQAARREDADDPGGSVQR